MALAPTNNNFYHALLIEDDEIDRRTVERAISRDGNDCTSDCVKRISEVSAKMKGKHYDIIITDMNLPDSEGIETINKLLELAGKTPIVVVSGTDDDEIALKAVHSGAQDYIPKRYISDAGLLTRTLRHAIERHQLKLSLETTRDRERFIAHYDQCTSLPNRLLLLDRLNQLVLQAQRQADKFTVFFIDLDRFKDVNDNLGHSAGDTVLNCVGKRMKEILREHDTVARFGGDEFVLILNKINDKKHLKSIANKIIKTINEPINHNNQECQVGASIGIASYPRHGHSSQVLLKHADMAMYEAKKNGRNQSHFFNLDLFEQARHSFDTEKALREALRNPDKHFQLHYQSKVNLESGKINSAEALIRWKHPENGWVRPDEFIPYAEDLGLIEKIDEWVLQAACKRALIWQAADQEIRICINLSSRSFYQHNFVSSIVEPILNQYKVSGSCLEVEITERVLLDNTQQVHKQLLALKKLGITIAIDDFGTGFSSLSYLNHFPFDTLKIDGSFICDKTARRKDKALLKAIIDLGRTLKLTVVAECIETEAQMQYLKSLQCHQGQGFYWGEPSKNWKPTNKLLSNTLSL